MANKNDLPDEATSSVTSNTTDTKTDSFRLKSLRTLRRFAEKILREDERTPREVQGHLSPEELKRVIHELQVHQIELEAQNEELHRTQKELELARARYFDLYDLAPVGYCTISGKGLILEANFTAANLLEIHRSSLVGHPLSRFIYNEDQDSYYLYRKKLLESHLVPPQGLTERRLQQTDGLNRLQAVELRMVKKNGTVFWVDLRETIAQNLESGPAHLVVLSDITERKQIEDQHIRLEAKNRHLQKAESLERMAGSISHIFNNHLQVMLGNLEIVMGTLEAGAVARGNLADATQAALRASEVSGLLLTYLGQNNAKLDPLDLTAICQQNLPEIRAAMPSNITLETEFIAPGPVVYANTRQLQQIVTDLVTNAWESIGDRVGRVKIVIKIIPASIMRDSHVSHVDWFSSAKIFACLEVTDTGCGISREEIDKVFDPFFTTKFTGRGLGLATIMGLIRAWGGMIYTKSALGEGSCFSIFLPLLIDIAPRQTENVTKHENLKAEGAVLLVDDDEVICKVMEPVLINLGFTVFVAKGGSEAIALFHKHQDTIVCLLTDLSMPGMDGWETLTALRKIQPNLPVILSSGYDESEVMHGDHEEMPQAFLHKPYTKDDLKIVLTQVLGDATPKSAH
ncbi:MAG: response regulator [Desulforhopalus sp.]